MNRSDDKVEACKNIICVIKYAVAKNITLDTLKYLERLEFLIQLAYFSMLGNDPLFCQSISVCRGFAMITDHHIFPSSPHAFPGHAFDGFNAITPFAMAMD